MQLVFGQIDVWTDVFVLKTLPECIYFIALIFNNLALCSARRWGFGVIRTDNKLGGQEQTEVNILESNCKNKYI